MGGDEEDPNQGNQPIEGDSPPRLSEDQLYQVLTSNHRQRILYYLLEEQNSTVENLATVLSGWEATRTGTMQTPADRSELLVQLIHNHLPQLADMGLVDYEPHTGSVQIEPLHPQVADIIRQSGRAEPREDRSDA